MLKIYIYIKGQYISNITYVSEFIFFFSFIAPDNEDAMIGKTGR